MSPGSLIEIGAGSGGFSAAARAAGFDVTAIEMDEGCCDFLNNEIGVRAICSDAPLDTLNSPGQADTIVLWHVLEHLRNPAEVLEAAAGKLREGGILALAVPNPKSLQFKVLGSRWPHLDAPRHLALIPPATLMARANELGLDCVAGLADDPDGLESDLFGWVDGLRRRPAHGQASKVQQYLGLGLCRLLAPAERKGLRGAAVTLVFRKRADL